ncbi:hypothetical protein ACJJTC_018583 [Scirpophaga incertulas]
MPKHENLEEELSVIVVEQSDPTIETSQQLIESNDIMSLGLEPILRRRSPYQNQYKTRINKFPVRQKTGKRRFPPKKPPGPGASKTKESALPPRSRPSTSYKQSQPRPNNTHR